MMRREFTHAHATCCRLLDVFDADLVEQLSPSLYLFIQGSVVTPIATSQLSGPLQGVFDTFTHNPRVLPPSIPIPAIECYSVGHQFVLSR